MPNSAAASGPPCPVCGAASRRAALLSQPFLVAALEAFVETPAPRDVRIGDYAMCRCPECQLEFADPPRPADDAFYDWLDRTARYYPGDRWEWGAVEALVRAQGGAPAVLEFGAGDATFLRRLAAGGARVAAVERSAAAVAALRGQGLEAHAAADADAALRGRRFDFVLAFHCVEHVADPLALVRGMRALAGERGRVLFSVPYSPMYFESRWFDPLNHPPHHLTRWNAAALERLCARAGGRARLSLPEPQGLLYRARHALAIDRLGAHWHRRPRRARALPLLHPLAFLAELRRQARRERVGGRVAADVVLVELSGGGPSG